MAGTIMCAVRFMLGFLGGILAIVGGVGLLLWLM